MSSGDCNLTRISGRLIERNSLRRTPAGIPIQEFVLGHVSKQLEADTERIVECEVDCIAVGQLAHALAASKPGDALKLSGFLASRSVKQRGLKLHVNTVEFMEGIENGI